jgi:predicted lactoylglutathione lyase
MFDPVKFGVSNYAASEAFFLKALEPLGVAVISTAEKRQQVEAFYRAALEAGGKDNGAPGLRPHYHANYYAAFVIGPDGHNIDVVCHEPEA